MKLKDVCSQKYSVIVRRKRGLQTQRKIKLWNLYSRLI